jgi:hypothetical protein
LEKRVLLLMEERNNLQSELKTKEEDFQSELLRIENDFRSELAERDMDLAARQITGIQRNSEVEHALKGSKYEWAILLKSKGMPFVKKETDPSSIIEMVSAAI